MIDPAVTDEQVEHYSFAMMVDLITLFKSLRADVMDAIRSDNPLAALEAVFGVIPVDEDDAEEDQLQEVIHASDA
jgi:hypothetical protein